jgi:hypothetical protein
MGDYRLNVRMALVGADGQERKTDLWLNWHEECPAKVVEALMELANKSQLPACRPYDRYLTDDE